eukprot:snap_masked-scaffold487_size158652-processed-gene-0.33 protein:Tk00175 transcript:snap_masked-scaffold487_size158652-processed-gene-0.33-mRNA-1 annotation:"transcriptional adapter 2b isoform x2"
MSSMLPAKIEREVGSGVSELYQRYTCDYCQEDIPGLRIKCGDCADFDLCLPCFACGAQLGKHKTTHRYIFMNNGGFNIFPSTDCSVNNGGRLKRLNGGANLSFSHHGLGQREDADGQAWNAREEMRLLDAVEMYGYGNWKDIAGHIESKSAEQCKEELIKHFIHGLVGKHTWKEELRGYAVDHTQAADRGPLSPTLTGKLPPINVSGQEALLLGYMPHRDDYEEFDKDTENLVAQIADKSVEDEDVDIALKLAQCDIYERRLREQVRRKRVARDYQLVSKFYRENPIVQIGGGSKLSPLKISNQVKAVKRGEGPKQELLGALKSLTQFLTSQEQISLVSNLCVEKELKVRTQELLKYRLHGLTQVSDLIPFEQARFKRELKLKRVAKQKNPATNLYPSRFLPVHGDYSLRAILGSHASDKNQQGGQAYGGVNGTGKKRPKKTLWSRKKMKTGRRLLLQQGCILTLASPARRDSSDGN